MKLSIRWFMFSTLALACCLVGQIARADADGDKKEAAAKAAADGEKKEAEVKASEAVQAAVKAAIQAVGGKPAVEKPAEEKKEGEKKEAEPMEVIKRTPAPPLAPNFIRLHLQDGNIISGDLTVNEVTVETQFGKLIVPIAKIRSFVPGLDSSSKLAAEIEDLIKKLGSDDYKTREQAHKDLSAKGARIQMELAKHIGSENAEVKRHVSDILKEFEEQAEEKEDDGEGGGSVQPLIRLDTVVTTDFTAVGRVTPVEFTITSKYGPLVVQLADINRAERHVEEKSSVRKSISVTAANLVQRSFKSTGIRVQAGDRVSIKAEGSMVMSPWGSNAQSTPDGAQNYGWYIPNQIAGGALVAKIGDKGQIFKAGRSHTFVAKTSGMLQLGIGMQAEYSGDGYQFPGEYKVKLKVDSP